MKKLLPVLFLVALAFTMIGCGATFLGNPAGSSAPAATTTASTALQTAETDVTAAIPVLQASVNWAVPVATDIIGVVGSAQEKADMNTAAASVGALNTIVANAQGSGSAAQTQSAFAALQTAWNAMNSVITAQPTASKQVVALPAAVAAAQ
ncbi:MAG: hypothetical protein ABSF90_10505 [Syntrophobacteraceae bacterium]|jgi:hypothetical protein